MAGRPSQCEIVPFMLLKKIGRRVVPAKLRQSYQAWRLRRMMARHAVRVVSHRYGDGEFRIELADPLAVGWYDHDWPLPVEIGLLRKSRLGPGAIVFDLGAHHGVVALMLGREVGKNGKVVAVEAHPHNAAAAMRNRDLNDMPWIEVVSAAVAGTDGSLLIDQSLNAQVASVSDYGGTLEVPAVTIDTLAARHGRPDVVYLDVEGMELEALRGATHTLADRPDFFVEVHIRNGLEAAGGSVGQVLAHFPQSDYETFVHSDYAPSPVSLASAPAELLADRFFLTALSRPPVAHQ
jgi:FkbM family methyltransferase